MAPGLVGQTIRYDDAQRECLRFDLRASTALQRAHGQSLMVVTYDVSAFDFAAQIRRLLVAKGLVDAAALTTTPLAALHTLVPAEAQALDSPAFQLNDVSRAFYDTDAEFLELYRAFMRAVVVPLFRCDLLVQATPTIRLHFPRPKGFEFLPTFHSDVMLGHPPHGVNIWLPVTRAFDSNALRIMARDASLGFLEETDLDFDEFARRTQEDQAFYDRLTQASASAPLEPGQFVVFDAPCIHATQYNETEATRISLDVRVLAVSDHEARRLDYHGSGRRHLPFTAGGYYDASVYR